VTPILLALAAAAQPAPAPAPGADTAETRFRACTTLARTDPNAAARQAAEWQGKGGGLEALQCLGLAQSGLEKWPEAAVAFEQAAAQAERSKDPRGADFRVQAGNSWLAAGDSARARKAFDAALASTSLSPQLRGEVHLDRARAAVAAGDPEAGRADIDKGLELVPGDPFGWYLSAALARRQGDLKRAQTDIARAVSLAPGDAPILVEAGNIAGLSGEAEAAKALYARAARAAPDSDAGRAARAALAANGGEAEPAAAPSP
jgi:tetratricopeptide (TPR) repeat protein